MAKPKDITGKRFTRLTAIRPVGKTKDSSIIWRCVCDCGEEIDVTTSRLTRGNVKSCGCLRRELNTSHGMSRTRLFRSWWDMKSRCYGNQKQYVRHYQERGITVCDEWKDSFESFRDWALTNGYHDELSLDRIEVDKGYCPSNCRWATRIQQANNKTDSHFITINGETRTIAEWARHVGIAKEVIFSRLRTGWNEQDAVTKPVDKKYGVGKLLEYNGKCMSMSEWARELDITPQSLEYRLKNGWSVEKTLTTPRGKTGPHRSKQEK